MNSTTISELTTEAMMFAEIGLTETIQALTKTFVMDETETT